MAQGRMRGFASAACGTVGLVLIFLAVLIGYTRRSLFDEQAFATHVSASLRDPRVAEFAAEQIADGVLAAKPDLVGLRPMIVGMAQSVVRTPPFRAAVRRGARALHHSITSGQAQQIVLSVKDVGEVFSSATATQPELAKKIPPKLAARLVKLQDLPGGERAARILQFAGRVRTLAIASFLLGILLCVASVWLSAEKRAAIVRLGIGLAAFALILAATAKFGGAFLTLFMRNEALAPVLVGLASAFLGGLTAWAIGVGLTGVVLAAASASLLERVPLSRWGHNVRMWFVGPQPLMRYRLLRGLTCALTGAVFLFWPHAALTVTAWFAGVVIAFAGLREAFIAAMHLLPAATPRGARAKSEPAPRRGAVAFVAFLATLIVAGSAWALLRSPDRPLASEEPVLAYNGLPGLGDRTVDEVVFPTTHNSMGGANVEGWMFPNQSASVKDQLEDGVRGFMIDVHYATPAGEFVKTAIDSEGTALAKYEAEVGPAGMEAALRIRNRLTGMETGERDLYMCHGFCELGALKFEPALVEMRDFLVANPGEVIVLVLQDESIKAQDLAHAFEQSGLVDFVYRGPAGPVWPTLRELVESDQRVLVFTENLREGIPWAHNAFDVFQETPYTFHDKSEFSNKPNRGGTGGSLYLMNHWIESTPMPRPTNADTVNAHDFLMKRIVAFRKQRGHLPNLVAVDFYREGDLVKVARELNEEPLPPARH